MTGFAARLIGSGLRFPARAALVAAFVAAGLVVSGCGIPTATTANSIPAKKVPYDLLSPVVPTTTPTTQPGGYVKVPVYFTKTGARVLPEARYVAPHKSLTDVVAVLLQGPTQIEERTGIGTDIGVGVKLIRSTQKLRNTITLNFNTAFGTEEALGIAQVVYTVAMNEPDPPAVGVLFEITGIPIDVPLVTGRLFGEPVHIAQYSTLLAPTATATTSAP